MSVMRGLRGCISDTLVCRGVRCESGNAWAYALLRSLQTLSARNIGLDQGRGCTNRHPSIWPLLVCMDLQSELHVHLHASREGPVVPIVGHRKIRRLHLRSSLKTPFPDPGLKSAMLGHTLSSVPCKRCRYGTLVWIGAGGAQTVTL